MQYKHIFADFTMFIYLNHEMLKRICKYWVFCNFWSEHKISWNQTHMSKDSTLLSPVLKTYNYM